MCCQSEHSIKIFYSSFKCIIFKVFIENRFFRHTIHLNYSFPTLHSWSPLSSPLISTTPPLPLQKTASSKMQWPNREKKKINRIKQKPEYGVGTRAVMVILHCQVEWILNHRWHMPLRIFFEAVSRVVWLRIEKLPRIWIAPSHWMELCIE